jgi:hypothetical protein
MQREELQAIIDKAKNDTNEHKLTEDDINNLFNTIDHNTNEYLQDNTTETIIIEIFNILQDNNIDNIQDIMDKLKNYRYVDEIHLIHKGKNIKCINKQTNKFSNAGIVVDIKFLQNGTHILCKGFNNFKQIKLDDNFIFQQLTTEELFILMSNNI